MWMNGYRLPNQIHRPALVHTRSTPHLLFTCSSPGVPLSPTMCRQPRNRVLPRRPAETSMIPAGEALAVGGWTESSSWDKQGPTSKSRGTRKTIRGRNTESTSTKPKQARQWKKTRWQVQESKQERLLSQTGSNLQPVSGTRKYWQKKCSYAEQRKLQGEM